MEIKNNVFVITGAARGLGFEIAKNLASAGGKLALVDLNQQWLDEAVNTLQEYNVEIRTYITNVANEDQVIELFNKIQQDFGQIDGLVNNAGITRDALLVKHKNGQTTKMSLEQWQQVIDVNLTGVFLCGREAAAKMVENGRKGVIVNISSISRDGNIGQSNYSAAKAGVSALTATWGKELARYGVRCGAVAPGFACTDMVKTIPGPVLDKIVSDIPLRRLAKPEEIAHTVRYIVENDYFTTRTIPIGGGLQV
ncbi:MAG: SDR family oxidoreductase [Deltaproteobacteria bacterium]|jgi:3-oxoacyl-[acyl-carrier protein] reductase|nr:SDR family oxidoreductase [Deltaproteobacteria bacterium]MBW2519227.1 SDR family oxidoreductase [Deltaproteobacteria bacterium]